jgi:hypothetical protein
MSESIRVQEGFRDARVGTYPAVVDIVLLTCGVGLADFRNRPCGGGCAQWRVGLGVRGRGIREIDYRLQRECTITKTNKSKINQTERARSVRLRMARPLISALQG